MIQIRNNVFETNSSSSHSLCVMSRKLYNKWRNHEIVLSIYYVYEDDRVKTRGCKIKPVIELPENFLNKEAAKKVAKELDGDESNYIYYHGLEHGDNGFMRTQGNFDTYGAIVRELDTEKQKEENVKMLYDFIAEGTWECDYLKKSNAYDAFVQLIETYRYTGTFTEDMYNKFPGYLFFTPEQLEMSLRYDDCDSPFIHVFADVVAMGYYFHS